MSSVFLRLFKVHDLTGLIVKLCPIILKINTITVCIFNLSYSFFRKTDIFLYAYGYECNKNTILPGVQKCWPVTSRMVHLEMTGVQHCTNALTINDLPNELLIYIFSMIDFE